MREGIAAAGAEGTVVASYGRTDALRRCVATVCGGGTCPVAEAARYRTVICSARYGGVASVSAERTARLACSEVAASILYVAVGGYACGAVSSVAVVSVYIAIVPVVAHAYVVV